MNASSKNKEHLPVNIEPRKETKWSEISLHDKCIIGLTAFGLLIAILTALFVVKQTIIAQNVFESTERPYVAADGVPFIVDLPNKQMTAMVRVKNYGSNPAEDVEIGTYVYFDGAKQPISDPHPVIGKLYQGVTRNVDVIISKVDFPKIESGEATLSLDVTSTYHWWANDKTYTYCEQFKYSPADDRNFATIGNCPKEHSH